MRISVIVPHFNQEDYLRQCLERLTSQTGHAAEVEIIVVDNGSDRMPQAVCDAFPTVKLLSEVTPGPGPARNTGAASAVGEVLAFIDADCHADSGWLAAIEARFGLPDTQIIGGDVRVGYADPAKPTFLEPYEAIFSFRNQQHIAEGYSGTGNLATRAEILRHVGPFGGIDIAEDRDWGRRARALGYRIDYVPRMIVYHPARKSFHELAQKWARHIAHDYPEKTTTNAGKVKWFLRAMAMAVSPLKEVPLILRSSRISGLRERATAFACLCAIRLYRSKSMLGVMLFRGHNAEVTWRQKP
ncbi:MAG: glycosyltransferase [Tabrizicola sp.]|jgi:GT2 family glycosyltransferase|nr:glycosyltransferase [Tabrizicola sp.]